MRMMMAGVLAATLLIGGTALAVDEPDELMAGTSTTIKTGKLAKFTGKPASGDLPNTENDPTVKGASLHIFDTGAAANDDTYTLSAAGWSRIPAKTTKPLKGYKYKGVGADPCKSVVIKSTVVKASCKGAGIALTTPFTGNVGIILAVGTSNKRYCASFGGNGKNDVKQTKRKGASPPSACPSPVTPTTSTLASTTSTTSSSTSTSSSSSTSSTIIVVTTTTIEETTTTSTSSTTSTTDPGATTTTLDPGATTSTSTSSTTSTTVAAACCNGDDFVSFATVDAPGDCGEITHFSGSPSVNLACAGLYTGGGGNSVPLPLSIPDLGQAVSAITACTGQSATLGSTTSADTGSNRTCTSLGCLFGAPLAVPNPDTPPTSVCVLNRISGALNGMADCSTGATDVSLPLGPILYLTGDAATDPMSTIPGVQPCPLCTGGDPMTPGSGSCIGGPNDGLACTPGTTTLSGDPAYPTSHDCPPDPMADIGTLPIGFNLTTGSVTWTATTATNDTETETNQLRVFSGFCRDVDDTGAFQDPPQKCWENGEAVGAPCSGTFETCEQRNNGAFGPNGNGTRTITAIGSSSSILGGPAPGTLVSVFSIPATANATVDAAGDLPGPGAVAIPGTAQLCATANPCP